MNIFGLSFNEGKIILLFLGEKLSPIIRFKVFRFINMQFLFKSFCERWRKREREQGYNAFSLAVMSKYSLLVQ